MLGPTVTTTAPEVAPDGTVKMMEVAVHELIVVAAPLSVTWLPETWVLPKFEPVTVTWVPTGPVVADNVLIAGAGAALDPTDTLSNVAVPTVEEPLATARPMYTFDAMVTV